MLGGAGDLPGEVAEEILAVRAPEHILAGLGGHSTEVADGGIVVNADEGKLAHVGEVIKPPDAGLGTDSELKGISVEVLEVNRGAGEGEVQVASRHEGGSNGGAGDAAEHT